MSTRVVKKENLKGNNFYFNQSFSGINSKLLMPEDDTFKNFDIRGYKTELIKKVSKEKDKTKLTSKDFEMQPASIEEFLDSKYYLGIKDTLRPAIRKDIIELFKGKPFEWDKAIAYFYEAIGTGKSLRAAVVITYISHCLLCLYSPAEYFGLKKNTKILISNCSSTEHNANEIVFDYAYDLITSCPWFMENYLPKTNEGYISFDESPSKAKNKELGRIYKNIIISAGTSMPTSIAGFALFCGIIDEATLFPKTAKKCRASSLLRSMKTRLKSRFGNKGMIIVCGSPQEQGDFMQKEISKLKLDDEKVMVVNRPLWESKLEDPKDGYFWFDTENYTIYKNKKIIPKDHNGNLPTRIMRIPNIYYTDFDKDPETAKKDIAGLPLVSINPVMGNHVHLVKENANYERFNPVYEELNTMEVEKIFHEDFNWLDSEGNPLDEDTVFTVHCDIGLSSDAATMAMGHIMGKTENNEPVAQVDFVYRYKPDAKSRFKIKTFREMIYELSERGFNIGLITYDGYESEDSVSLLIDAGYNAKKRSLDKDPTGYYVLAEYIIDNRLDYPYHPVFIKELETIEKEDKTGKINHNELGSKDCSDSVAGVMANLQELISTEGLDNLY